MAVQYQVRSQVVDLRTDRPLATDRFYVDTNVWFWTAYPNVQFSPNAPQAARVGPYGAYLQAVIASGATLHWCGLSLAELAHLIEETEFSVYQSLGSQPTFSSVKEYRHAHAAERARVASEVEASWRAVEGMASPLPNAVTIDHDAVNSFLRAFPRVPLDGYDFFPLRTLHEAKITAVISDDGDFCTVPGIIFFTANRNVIAAAQAAGKLLVR